MFFIFMNVSNMLDVKQVDCANNFRFFFWWILIPCLWLCYLFFPKNFDFSVPWGLPQHYHTLNPVLCLLHPKQLRTYTAFVPKYPRTITNLNNFAIYFSNYSFVVVFKYLIAEVWVPFINFSRAFLFNLFQEKFFKFCGHDRMLLINCLPSS